MSNEQKHSHHLVPLAVYYKTIAALLFLTVVTVGASYLDFGAFFNTLVALGIASLKASLVMAFFMGLKFDHWLNRAVILSSFIALILFIGFSAADSWTREYGQPVQVKMAGAVLSYDELKKLENSTPDMMAKGKELYDLNCVVCHGATGNGDGIGGQALNPKPRNFHSPAGEWKNGNAPAAVFATLTYGSPGTGMAPYKQLSTKDRFALSHYVASMGGAGEHVNRKPELSEKAMREESAGATAGEAKTPVPVGFAIQQMLNEHK